MIIWCVGHPLRTESSTFSRLLVVLDILSICMLSNDASTYFSRLPDWEYSNPYSQYNTRYYISFVKFPVKISKRLVRFDERRALKAGSRQFALPTAKSIGI